MPPQSDTEINDAPALDSSPTTEREQELNFATRGEMDEPSASTRLR